MKIRQVLLLFISFTFVIGCAAPVRYDMAEFRTREIEYGNIALDRDGLTREQIETIAATKPPTSFPVDIALIVLINGYLDPRTKDDFIFTAVTELKKSDKIERITLIPDFLVPGTLDFNAIQELGVRSLSEYAIVFNIDASELFVWTKIIETKFEINSSVNYIFVDSFTSAMLTADKLTTSREYEANLFTLGERREAQKILFTEQAQDLAIQIDRLLGSAM
jgi:hypothetical protein